MMLLSEKCYLKGYIKGYIEGYKEGYQLGKTEDAKNSALNLYERNLSVAKIAHAVGVSEEQVRNWLNNAETQTNS